MPRAAVKLSPAREPRPPTPRQLEILAFMERFLADNRVPPSFREIGDAFGISSPNAIAGFLKSLVRKGLLKQTEVGRHRAYLPVALARCPLCGRPYPKGDTP
jgi:SOS-response transcriptional repressor LexA